MSQYTLLDQLKDGVQIIDAEMRYMYLNPALLSEIRMGAEEIVGERMVDRFPGIETTEVYRRIQRCFAMGQSDQIINEFTFSDGRKTFHELSLQRIEEGVIIFSRDITQTKTGEAFVWQSSQNIFQFAHITTHDMREPIRRIQVLAEELVLDHSQDLSAQGTRICEDLQRQSSELMRLVNDVRRLSEIGGIEPKRRACAVAVEARQVAQDLAPSVNKAVEVDWPPSDPQVSQVIAVPTLVRILLRHLLTDAFENTEGGVFFSVAEPDSGATPVFCVGFQTSEERRSGDVFSGPGLETLEARNRLSFLVVQTVVSRHAGRVWSEYAEGAFRTYFTLQPS